MTSLSDKYDGLSTTMMANVALDNADEVRAKIEELQKKMDQSDIGVYVADKFNQFANSDLACTTYKRCMTPPSEREQIPPSEFKELFPELKHYRELRTDADYVRTKSGRTQKAK